MSHVGPAPTVALLHVGSSLDIMRHIRSGLWNRSWEVSVLVSPSTPDPEQLERIAGRGPTGALALCGIAVAIVAAIWFMFYLFAFLPRGLLR